jgi:hypothetical protein
MERELAMARHEGKEAHRRTEQEQELRRKAEQDRAELRKRLDDETNRRTKEQNNSHHVAEKISSLEKERNQVSFSSHVLRTDEPRSRIIVTTWLRRSAALRRSGIRSVSVLMCCEPADQGAE